MFKFPNIPALLSSIVILLMLLAVNIQNTNAARTSDVWQERLGTYIETTWSEGRNILINGTNKYLNFGTFSGSSGYGIRDNAGTIECKDDGGSWSACQDGNSGGSGGGGLATTSPWTNGNLAFVTGLGTVGSVATGTISAGTGLSVTAGRAAVGGPLVISPDSGYTIPTTTGLANLYSNSHAAVTLSGALDYITLVGQNIVRGAIDLAADITGTLGVLNGGTGATTLDNLITLGTHTTGNYIATINGTSNEVAVSGSGSETAAVTLSLPSTIDLNSKTVKQHTYKSFTYPGVATTSAATTTVPLGTAFTAEAWNSAECWVTNSTGAVIFTDGTNRMNGFTATTTAARTTLSTNNTFTVSERRYVEVGPLTAAQLSCTVDVTVNN